MKVCKCILENKLYLVYTIFIMIAGTLLHFLYEWSGNNFFVRAFAATSESVWEHLKLLFIPAFFFTICLYGLKNEMHECYLRCQTKSILAGLLSIVVLYFTYKGILMRDVEWFNVAIFYIAALVSGVIACICGNGKDKEIRPENRHHLCRNNDTGSNAQMYSLCILFGLWILFVWFSYQIPAKLLVWFPGIFADLTLK